MADGGGGGVRVRERVRCGVVERESLELGRGTEDKGPMKKGPPGTNAPPPARPRPPRRSAQRQSGPGWRRGPLTFSPRTGPSCAASPRRGECHCPLPAAQPCSPPWARPWTRAAGAAAPPAAWGARQQRRRQTGRALPGARAGGRAAGSWQQLQRAVTAAVATAGEEWSAAFFRTAVSVENGGISRSLNIVCFKFCTTAPFHSVRPPPGPLPHVKVIGLSRQGQVPPLGLVLWSTVTVTVACAGSPPPPPLRA
jgi:hypothetical protein